MGRGLDKDNFNPEDHLEFRQRLQKQVEALRLVIAAPGFSSGPASLGAEIEYYLVGRDKLPVAKNLELLKAINNPLFTEELNQYNIELNLSPVQARGKPFSKMQREIETSLDSVSDHAQALGAELVSIGILPSLSEKHLEPNFMTDLPRYRALSNQLRALKGKPFEVNINGLDSLKANSNEVTLEGANTSLQVHLKVPADKFADLYNAAQLTTPLVMALAANSPLFLGRRLWQETRIALFKQSTDNRVQDITKWHQPARVSLGHGWVREGAWEIFAQNVALYRPLMPVLSADNEAFSELNFHHGTIWSWNRAVFEPKHGGHLRIEFRALPAGPTSLDMMANAAFAVGLAQAFSERVADLLPKLPFSYAEHNFYRAAQHGLEANILWPLDNQHSLRESHIADVIQSVLPLAADGLSTLGVDQTEIDKMMFVIESRFAARQTGASWQLACLEKYARRHHWEAALKYMLNDYIDNAKQNIPVAMWK